MKKISAWKIWIIALVGLCLFLALQLNSTKGVLDRCSQDFVNEHALRTLRESDLAICQSNLQQSTPVTSTQMYVLDQGVLLVEQWIENNPEHLFWLLPKGSSLEDGPEPKRTIGTFPAIPDPSGANAVTLERLSNGLYDLSVTADYTEAAARHITWIDPASMKFLVMGDSYPFSSAGISFATPDIQNGSLSIHFAQDDCATSSQGSLDGLTWNDKVVFRFNTPVRISCSYSEVGDEFDFFDQLGKPEIGRDLQSIILPLKIGKKLLLQFHGSDTPVIRVK